MSTTLARLSLYIYYAYSLLPISLMVVHIILYLYIKIFSRNYFISISISISISILYSLFTQLNICLLFSSLIRLYSTRPLFSPPLMTFHSDCL
ncbi:uncharacterized protein VTP21DRAFT_11169 [Calcarisporiella thermophila]|uniref:uncharacterized protein n=1 Tax=Calcarisporiella thermophila TaxID=911321 RepID=UPI0037428B06